MARFGFTEAFYPEFENTPLIRGLLRVVGNVETGSSHHLFIRTMNRLPFQKMDAVLDAGCGRGLFSFWLSRKYRHLQIDACDLSASKIALCQQIQKRAHTRCHFFTKDLLAFERDQKYDLIFSNHVLEHIVDNRKVINQLVASLKPGGFIYIQIPNATQWRLLPDKYLRHHAEWAEEEHVGQTLTLDSLREMLEGMECRILKAQYTSGFLGELSFELKEIALHYLNSQVLFVLLFPLLKLLGYLDSLARYRQGNGILVLAQKRGEGGPSI
jgi:SAM-dependent methyltransferase